MPGAPDRLGFAFDGWYTDEQFTKAWDFDGDHIVEDMTLYAKWSMIIGAIFTGRDGGIIAELSSDMLGTVLYYHNESGAGQNLTMIVALYDGDNKLVQLKTDTQAVAAGAAGKFEAALIMADNADGHYAQSGYKVNVYLWGGGTYIPVIPKEVFPK